MLQKQLCMYFLGDPGSFVIHCAEIDIPAVSILIHPGILCDVYCDLGRARHESEGIDGDIFRAGREMKFREAVSVADVSGDGFDR